MTSSEALHSDARPGSGQVWTPQLWGVLIVLGGALCLDGLDVSMVGVALPSIRTALGLKELRLNGGLRSSGPQRDLAGGPEVSLAVRPAPARVAAEVTAEATSTATAREFDEAC